MNASLLMITMPPRPQVVDVRAQRGRVERDEHVGLVGRRADVARGEVDLEARDARERAGWRADLGREVGERREVVARERGRLGELGAGQLDAVAGVAGEDGWRPARSPERLAWLAARRARGSSGAGSGGGRIRRPEIVSPGPARRKGSAPEWGKTPPVPKTDDRAPVCTPPLRRARPSSCGPARPTTSGVFFPRTAPLTLDPRRDPGAPALAQHARRRHGGAPGRPRARRRSWSTRDADGGPGDDRDPLARGRAASRSTPSRRDLREAASFAVALDAALSFAESMGFLFDEDELGDGGAPGTKMRCLGLWRDFLGEDALGRRRRNAPRSPEPAEELLLDELAEDTALEVATDPPVFLSGEESEASAGATESSCRSSRRPRPPGRRRAPGLRSALAFDPESDSVRVELDGSARARRGGQLRRTPRSDRRARRRGVRRSGRRRSPSGRPAARGAASRPRGRRPAREPHEVPGRPGCGRRGPTPAPPRRSRRRRAAPQRAKALGKLRLIRRLRGGSGGGAANVTRSCGCSDRSEPPEEELSPCRRPPGSRQALRALALALPLVAGCATTSPEAKAEHRAQGALATTRSALNHLQRGPHRHRDRASSRTRDKLDPNDPWIQLALAEAYRLKARNAEAERHLKRALELRPDFHAARLNLSALYIQMGRYEEAVELCERAPGRPTFPVPWKALTNQGWA